MLDKQEKIEREGLLRNIETIIGKIVSQEGKVQPYHYPDYIREKSLYAKFDDYQHDLKVRYLQNILKSLKDQHRIMRGLVPTKEHHVTFPPEDKQLSEL